MPSRIGGRPRIGGKKSHSIEVIKNISTFLDLRNEANSELRKVIDKLSK